MYMKKMYYLVSFVFFVAVPHILYATNIDLPENTGLPNHGKNDVKGAIEDVLNAILGILAVLSILMIVVSGVMYITSAGDQGRVDTAKKMLTYSIVGLVVSLLGYVIVFSVAKALGAV